MLAFEGWVIIVNGDGGVDSSNLQLDSQPKAVGLL